MIEIRVVMGMPVTIEIADLGPTPRIIDEVFSYFEHIDNKFSLYKEGSEISKINRGLIEPPAYSNEMKEVLRLSEETKVATKGFFDIEWNPGQCDPSGLVKGWAIYQAAQILKNKGYENFYVEAGGDMQIYGKNNAGHNWRVGIRNPFKPEEIIKTVALSNLGMATSGTYLRGQHIYNPHAKEVPILDIVSLTVIGPTVYEADRFATAAFAMGKQGIEFIEQKANLEGYVVDANGMATMTSGFNKYIYV